MPPRRLVIPLALVLSLLFAASAHAYVYWGDAQGGTIGRANLDGTNVEGAFIQTGGKPLQLAVDSAHIYWANESGGTIGRAKLDGTQIEPNFITGLGQPSGVAVTSAYIFWSTVGGSIGRANLDGSGKQPNLVTGVGVPCGVAVDSGSVYWQTNLGLEGFVGRATFTGGSPQLKFVKTESAGSCGVAVNSANIFWANTGFLTPNGTEIGRANASDGKAVNPSLIGDATGPCGIAVFGTQLYWANEGSSTIGRANTDGTGVDEELLKAGGGELCGIAVDSLSSPVIPPATQPAPPPTTPAQPPTPGTIRLLNLKPDPRHGTARLKVEVDEAGVVSLSGKGVVAAKATARAAGPVTLSVRAAKAKLATLTQTGRLATKLIVTFVPGNGGAKAVLRKSSTLRKG